MRFESISGQRNTFTLAMNQNLVHLNQLSTAFTLLSDNSQYLLLDNSVCHSAVSYHCHTESQQRSIQRLGFHTNRVSVSLRLQNI